jgi:SAM-dependent methyltransferase
MDTATSLMPPSRLPTGVRCRCCGSADVRLIGTKDGAFAHRPFKFYACGSCSLQFVDPVLGFSIYDDAYYAGRGPDPAVNYEEEYQDYTAGGRILEYQDLLQIARMSLRLPDDRSTVEWLDFGCGAGGLLRFLRDQSTRLAWPGKRLNLFGQDVGSYATRLAENDRLAILPLEHLHTMREAFHVISCVEVLEHLPSPTDIIDLFGKLLRPGGVLLLTTGNMHSLAARWRGIHFSYCIPEIHISLFNPALLERLYRNAGLVPLKVQYRGTVEFRILKRVRTLPLNPFLARLGRLRPIVSLADLVYGTSAMPCARKPLTQT